MTGLDQSRNILLLVVDTVREQTFRTLLNNGDLPNIEQIAKQGTRFENAMANSSWTVPSHGSIFTGKYPRNNGITGENPMYDSNTFLPDILRENGYRSGGFSANPWLTPDFGFDDLFDFYISEWERYGGGGSFSDNSIPGSNINRVTEGMHLLKNNDPLLTLGNYAHAFVHKFFADDDGGEHLVTRATSWMNNVEEPWFCFINLTEAHLEYAPKKRYAEPFLPDGATYREAMNVPQSPWEYVVGETEMSERDFRLLESLYKGEIKYLDQLIGELVKGIESSSELDETKIIIVGDHGENIGDYGLMDHQYSVHQTLLNVPLVISPTSAESVSKELVELRDLFNIVIRTAGIEYDEPGVSDRDIFEDPREYAIAEYMSPRPSLEKLSDLTQTIPDQVRTYDRPIRTIITQENIKFVEYGDNEYEWRELQGDDELQHKKQAGKYDYKGIKNRLHEVRGKNFAKDSSVYDPTGNIGKRLEDLGYI